MNLYEKLTNEQQQQIEESYEKYKYLKDAIVDSLKNERIVGNLTLRNAFNTYHLFNELKPFNFLELHELFEEKENIKKLILESIKDYTTYEGYTNSYDSEIVFLWKEEHCYINLKHSVIVEEEKATKFNVEEIDVIINDISINLDHISNDEIIEQLKF